MVAAELQGWKGLAVKTKKGVRREREGKWLVMVVIVRKMRGHLGKLPFLNAFIYFFFLATLYSFISFL